MTRIPDSIRSDIDLFDNEALANPYPRYQQLRALGPAAYLNQYDLWFLGRHQQVRSALGDWQTFSSARGIGLNATINSAWDRALIHLDPPAHTEMRKLITERLGPREIKSVEDIIDRRADELTEHIRIQKEFDAVRDIACDLPVNLIMDLIGWPEEVRAELLDMANNSFDCCGPENQRMQASLPRLESMMAMIERVYDANTLTPGGFGSTIADAARRGEIPREAAIGLLAGYVVAAFDTTINGIASGLWLFARHPAEWDKLRADPDLVTRAFNEILRLETPIQHFSRVTTREVDIGDGVVIPAGARVVVSYASANRDEASIKDPETFNITRAPVPNLAFGSGVHACAGQGLARLEAHAVFRSLARHIHRIELTGEPVRALNNITRGFASLPARALA